MYLVCMNGRTKRMEVRTEKQTDSRGTDVCMYVQTINVPCGILHRTLFYSKKAVPTVARLEKPFVEF
jgi:hypothetical protein